MTPTSTPGHEVAYLPPPPDGSCVTEDGSIHPAFMHDGQHGPVKMSAGRKARAICTACPVLAECQDWAAQFSDWAAVTVAAWTASAQFPGPPPWSPLVDQRKEPHLRVLRKPVA